MCFALDQTMIELLEKYRDFLFHLIFSEVNVFLASNLLKNRLPDDVFGVL